MDVVSNHHAMKGGEVTNEDASSQEVFVRIFLRALTRDASLGKRIEENHVEIAISFVEVAEE